MTVNAELLIRFKDGGAAAGLNKIGETADKVASKSAAAAEKMYKNHVAAERYSLAAVEHFERQHEQLKIRSERTIRAEISQTQQAYKSLAASGLYSAKELSRAYDAQIKRVRDLRNEMGELTKAQKAMAALPIAAGVGAAAYTLKSPAMAAMSFDERLANMANTAFSERDTSGRRAGMKQLESAINKAVGKGGGGTRDQAAETLDTMIASGAMTSDDAIKMLPQIMRASSASGANANELAQIGIRSMQTFKIKPEDMPNVLNMALAAGQAGGFELKDMAKWLPQQMAAGTMSGLSGRAGFAKLAALNQAAAITAGTKDEAGNNVVNLLAKINSSDTAKDAQKMGVNLPAYLQSQRSKGVDSVDAFAALVDKSVSSRGDYQIAKKQLSSAKTGDDKRAALESMATIAQGAGIGKLIQDRQALMALLGMMNNRQYMQDVLGKVKANDVSSGGAIDKNYDLVSETSAFKLRQAEQQKDIGQKAAMDGLTPYVGKAAEAFADIAAKHPLLAGATMLATSAVTAFAAATGLAAMVVGGGKGGAVPGVLSNLSNLPGKIPRSAKIGGVAGVAALAGNYALSAGFGEESAVSRYGSAALNGASIGATVGSIVPGLGTGIGAAVGGGIGLLYQGIQDALKASDKKPVDVNANMTVGLAPGLVLQNQAMQTSGGGNVKLNTGNVWNGAPS